VEGCSSRVEKWKTEPQSLKIKKKLKKKQEILVKQFKSCERNMHELSNSNKRPNLRIMGIEDAEGVQVNGIHNIINKIVTKFHKSQEIFAHSGTGSLQITKQT
jgi:glucose-6-phosphate 1-dehydrogenase